MRIHVIVNRRLTVRLITCTILRKRRARVTLSIFVALRRDRTIIIRVHEFLSFLFLSLCQSLTLPSPSLLMFRSARFRPINTLGIIPSFISRFPHTASYPRTRFSTVSFCTIFVLQDTHAHTHTHTQRYEFAKSENVDCERVRYAHGRKTVPVIEQNTSPCDSSPRLPCHYQIPLL